MTVVRNRADARWLPSRFHFALFRLFAYFRLRAAKPEPHEGLVLAIERHQTAIENYIVNSGVFIVIAAFVASMIPLPTGAACAVAIPVTAIYINAQIVLTAITIAPIARRIASREVGIAVNSTVFAVIVIAMATLLAVTSSPFRYVGMACLGAVAANAIAALVVLLMQRPIAELERRYEPE